ncbi:hypothetical protein PC121_g10195 [Phytophthora cactorum]|nr:hypothetical protein PC120_g8847 [Phytophthora cactorum]KAG3068448.1 hypothetical protein PC121_g10195 [Phytophthora cactorum]KAG4056018.1 hypothetical protein PC123_g8891 [Phytophthora cactorum]
MADWLANYAMDHKRSVVIYADEGQTQHQLTEGIQRLMWVDISQWTEAGMPSEVLGTMDRCSE